MHNIFRTTFVTLSAVLMCSFSRPDVELVSTEDLKQPIQQTIIEEIPMESYEDATSSSPVVVEEEPIIIPVAEIPEEPQYSLTEEAAVSTDVLTISEEEIDLIALVTMAEAEGESEKGKRLVISTILNRVDSELRYFPDTVTEVIYQPSQFSSMWDGRVDRCYVDEAICDLVRDELQSRTNSEVLYFHADKYGKYGTPSFVEGNHYFSTM